MSKEVTVVLKRTDPSEKLGLTLSSTSENEPPFVKKVRRATTGRSLRRPPLSLRREVQWRDTAMETPHARTRADAPEAQPYASVAPSVARRSLPASPPSPSSRLATS